MVCWSQEAIYSGLRWGHIPTPSLWLHGYCCLWLGTSRSSTAVSSPHCTALLWPLCCVCLVVSRKKSFLMVCLRVPLLKAFWHWPPALLWSRLTVLSARMNWNRGLSCHIHGERFIWPMNISPLNQASQMKSLWCMDNSTVPTCPGEKFSSHGNDLEMD